MLFINMQKLLNKYMKDGDKKVSSYLKNWDVNNLNE